MKTSDQMKTDVLLDLESGRDYSEGEALLTLLSISSQEAREGKLITGQELLAKLKEKLGG